MAQDVEHAALAGEQVAGEGADGQQLLARLHPVAVLDVPLDLELVRADHGEDGLGDAQPRDGAGLAGGEVTGGDGVLGDGREGRDVLAAVEVLLDGQVGEVLDLQRVQPGLGDQAGELGVEPALEGVRVVLAGGAAAGVAAATGGGLGALLAGTAELVQGTVVVGAHAVLLEGGGSCNRREGGRFGGGDRKGTVRAQGHEEVPAPRGVRTVGVVLAPVAAAGLLAAEGGRDKYLRDEEEVGGLPRLGAGLDGPVGGLLADAGELLRRALQALPGAQHSGAQRHGALDRGAVRGRDEGRRGLVRQGRVAGGDGGAGEVGGDALGEDEAFEERVGRQPVRAVHAGAGDLAARVQPRHGRASVQVRAHSARGVVRGRCHGDRLGHRVDAVRPAGGQDRGEAVLPHLRAEVPGVEVHVLGVLFAHAPQDALGDDVARGEFGQFVRADHEAVAVGVDEVGALAAHRLRHQRLLALRVGAEPEHGGVELDELQVGDLGAGPQGEGDAVAGGDGGVGGRGEHLAHAAGGQDDGPGPYRADAVVPAFAHDVQRDARRTAVGVLEEVQDEGVLDRLDAGRAHGLDQGAGDLGAGGVTTRMGDAAAVVSALTGQQDLAGLGVGVEAGAGGDEAAHRVGALGDQGVHGLVGAEAGAGDEGVVQVLFGGVALAERGGYAALGPAGGAGVEAGLGDDGDLLAGGGAAQRDGEAGDAGADDDDVGVDDPAGAGCVQSYAGHRAAPTVRGRLSIRRVVPTLAATARTASPVWSSGTSVKSAGSTRAT